MSVAVYAESPDEVHTDEQIRSRMTMHEAAVYADVAICGEALPA